MADVVIPQEPGIVTFSGSMGATQQLPLSIGNVTFSGSSSLTKVISLVPGETQFVGGASTIAYLYVVDSGNNRIQVFDYSGNYKFQFGTYGTGNGQFIDPYGICTDEEYLYVTDSGNHRVQKFDLYGNYVSQFGTRS